MKYVVTGGAGFIGSHLVEELVRQYHEVAIVTIIQENAGVNIREIARRGSMASGV